ncbi:hypothetical protein MXB_5570 [Myxobolus squamalis]|nr:hypothetical protein MXB_5570 [Myxobolus squamalis]
MGFQQTFKVNILDIIQQNTLFSGLINNLCLPDIPSANIKTLSKEELMAYTIYHRWFGAINFLYN